MFLGVLQGATAAEELFQTGEEMRMIPFYRHEVVASVEADLVGVFLLAAHGIKAEGVSLEGKKIEKFRHGGNLVGLGVDFELGQAESLLAGKGAEQMQVALFARAVKAVTKGFAVNGDQLGRKLAAEAFHKTDEAGVEGLWIDGAEDPPKGIVAGNSAGEFEEFFEP